MHQSLTTRAALAGTTATFEIRCTNHWSLQRWYTLTTRGWVLDRNLRSFGHVAFTNIGFGVCTGGILPGFTIRAGWVLKRLMFLFSTSNYRGIFDLPYTNLRHLILNILSVSSDKRFTKYNYFQWFPNHSVSIPPLPKSFQNKSSIQLTLWNKRRTTLNLIVTLPAKNGF